MMYKTLRSSSTFGLLLVSFLHLSNSFPFNMNQGNGQMNTNKGLWDHIKYVNSLEKDDDKHFDSKDHFEEEEDGEVILDRIARVNSAAMNPSGNELETNEFKDIVLHEGDMVMNNTQYNHLLAHDNSQSKRLSVLFTLYLWTSKTIPYDIDSKMPSSTTRLIRKALDNFEKNSCLTFVPRKRESNWIRFVRQKGCWSYVGRQRSGVQPVSIGNGCDVVGIIEHEVMHALGFYHEQSRPDRNSYISIFWENISPDNLARKCSNPFSLDESSLILLWIMHGSVLAVTIPQGNPRGRDGNFRRYSRGAVSTLGLGYDYGSVMHYGSRYFSKNGKPTIRAMAKLNFPIGQRIGLSTLDHAKLNLMYDCSFHKEDSWSRWSLFSPCSKNCRKVRQRFCFSKNPGSCKGASRSGIQAQSSRCPKSECYAPVDGHWGRWSRFTTCSASCGIGVHRRSRSCNDPSPANGGKACVGGKDEVRSCRLRICNKGPYDCDFTDNTCTWEQSTKDNFDWTRISEGTPSFNTGPDWDHTGLILGVNESYGYFMYIETSQKPSGYRARLRSGIFNKSSGGANLLKCISFFYHMYGSRIGRLNVYVVLLTGQQARIWTRSGNQGQKWHQGMATFGALSPYRVVFEGVRGYGFTGDIAIDDITVKNHKCGTK